MGNPGNFFQITKDFEVVGNLSTHIKLVELLHHADKSNFIYVDHFFSHHQSFSQFSLGPDARSTLLVENAGGQSEVSEALSVEYMCQVFGGRNVIPEMDIQYWIDYKMADYIITIFGKRVGVSVTRAMGYPDATHFSLADADRLLQKKMNGLIVARNCTNDEHSFFKSMLHIWCQSTEIAQFLIQAYDNLDPEFKDDVIVACTVASNSSFVFNNRNN